MLLLSYSLNIFILIWFITWLMGYFLFPNICKFLICLLLISNLIFCEISILNLQILIWWLSTWSILVTILFAFDENVFQRAILVLCYLPLYVYFLCASLFVLLVFSLSLISSSFAQFFWDGRLVYIFSGILMFWSAFTSIKFPFPFASSTNFNMMCLYSWVKIFIFYCGFCLDSCVI